MKAFVIDVLGGSMGFSVKLAMYEDTQKMVLHVRKVMENDIYMYFKLCTYSINVE